MDEPNWLLVLTVPPSLEESLIDWLLNLETPQGFTGFPVSGHSSRPVGLTLAEQVSGRKKQIRFEIHLSQSEVDSLLSRLAGEFAGSGIHYWVVPVDRVGHI